MKRKRKDGLTSGQKAFSRAHFKHCCKFRKVSIEYSFLNAGIVKFGNVSLKEYERLSKEEVIWNDPRPYLNGDLIYIQQ